jgi:hypothetical protein
MGVGAPRALESSTGRVCVVPRVASSATAHEPRHEAGSGQRGTVRAGPGELLPSSSITNGDLQGNGIPLGVRLGSRLSRSRRRGVDSARERFTRCMDQEGDSLEDREHALSFHLLQYLIGLIRLWRRSFFSWRTATPLWDCWCVTLRQRIFLEACDVSVLASHGQCRCGLGDFWHPRGAMSNAGDPMSCGGRTVRSFTAEAAVVASTQL